MLILIATFGCAEVPLGTDRQQPVTIERGRTLSFWADGAEPVVVLTEPARIAEVLAVLPEVARRALIDSGAFESDDPAMIEAHRRALRAELQKHGVELGPKRVTWGQIKGRYV
jgi:hypothetical protein